MKERPIQFSTPMVRAILERRKTMTRRVVRPQPPDDYKAKNAWKKYRMHHRNWLICPYGSPGDHLWVQEKFALESASKGRGDSTILYHASRDRISPINKWRLPLYMPRWVSRLNLEVVAVRMERLQDITEEDAAREGCDNELAAKFSARTEFMVTWDSRSNDMKRPSGFDTRSLTNPWVWVVAFKLLDGDERADKTGRSKKAAENEAKST